MRAMTIRRGLGPLSLTCCLLALAAVPAQAQLGGLMKRAVEKRVGQKVDDQANIAMLVDPVFDETTVELTSARLQAYAAAAEKKKATAAADRAKASTMRDHISALQDSARAVQRPKEEDAYEQSTRRYEACRDGVREALDEAAEARIAQTAAQMQANPIAAQNDPKMKEMMKLVQQIGAAQQKGDAAEVQRLTQRYQAMFNQVTDSAAIDKAAASKCGARPTKPQSMVRAAAYYSQANAEQKEVDKLEGANGAVLGSAIGLTDEQAHMMWDRIMAFLSGAARKEVPLTYTFTRKEYDNLIQNRSPLAKALRGS